MLGPDLDDAVDIASKANADMRVDEALREWFHRWFDLATRQTTKIARESAKPGQKATSCCKTHFSVILDGVKHL
jgi:hypothetical protein